MKVEENNHSKFKSSYQSFYREWLEFHNLISSSVPNEDRDWCHISDVDHTPSDILSPSSESLSRWNMLNRTTRSSEYYHQQEQHNSRYHPRTIEEYSWNNNPAHHNCFWRFDHVHRECVSSTMNPFFNFPGFENAGHEQKNEQEKEYQQHNIGGISSFPEFQGTTSSQNLCFNSNETINEEDIKQITNRDHHTISNEHGRQQYYQRLSPIRSYPLPPNMELEMMNRKSGEDALKVNGSMNFNRHYAVHPFPKNEKKEDHFVSHLSTSSFLQTHKNDVQTQELSEHYCKNWQQLSDPILSYPQHYNMLASHEDQTTLVKEKKDELTCINTIDVDMEESNEENYDVSTERTELLSYTRDELNKWGAHETDWDKLTTSAVQWTVDELKLEILSNTQFMKKNTDEIDELIIKAEILNATSQDTILNTTSQIVEKEEDISFTQHENNLLRVIKHALIISFLEPSSNYFPKTDHLTDSTDKKSEDDISEDEDNNEEDNYIAQSCEQLFWRVWWFKRQSSSSIISHEIHQQHNIKDKTENVENFSTDDNCDDDVCSICGGEIIYPSATDSKWSIFSAVLGEELCAKKFLPLKNRNDIFQCAFDIKTALMSSQQKKGNASDNFSELLNMLSEEDEECEERMNSKASEKNKCPLNDRKFAIDDIIGITSHERLIVRPLLNRIRFLHDDLVRQIEISNRKKKAWTKCQKMWSEEKFIGANPAKSSNEYDLCNDMKNIADNLDLRQKKLQAVIHILEIVYRIVYDLFWLQLNQQYPSSANEQNNNRMHDRSYDSTWPGSLGSFVGPKDEFSPIAKPLNHDGPPIENVNTCVGVETVPVSDVGPKDESSLIAKSLIHDSPPIENVSTCVGGETVPVSDATQTPQEKSSSLPLGIISL